MWPLVSSVPYCPHQVAGNCRMVAAPHTFANFLAVWGPHQRGPPKDGRGYVGIVISFPLWEAQDGRSCVAKIPHKWAPKSVGVMYPF